MPRPDLLSAIAVAALLSTSPSVAAQQQTAAADPGVVSAALVSGDPAAAASEPRLVFEREVFSYRTRGRRDPFQPLTSAVTGPLFTDLKLHMILYSENPTESVVAIADGSNRQYRLRRGDSVGNATVIDIAPSRVVFSVVDFGIRRQEILNLKAKREGA
jgi:type II secretory pathway component PulC